MATTDLMGVFDPHNLSGNVSSAFARFDQLVAATGLRPILKHDDTTDWSSIGSGVIPLTYGGGGLTVKIHGSMSGANVSKTMSFDIAIERVAAAAVLTGGGSDFAAANNANPTVHADADTEFSFEIAFTDGADMDSLAAGEPYRILFKRDADGTTSTDDAVGDFQLYIAHVRET